MKTQRNSTEDCSQRSTRMKTTANQIECLEKIPLDLIIEILSRLRAKSIARCRCVSKLWESTLRLPCYTDLFLSRSSSHPQLLFSCQENGKLVFFSAPQFQNTDENSSIVSANYHTKFPFDGYVEISRSVCGTVGYIHRRRDVKGSSDTNTVAVICNPSTGQYVPLPDLNRKKYMVNYFFGYDPTDKQYKVLSMTCANRLFNSSIFFKEYQVLTLGNEKPSWRKVECSILHSPLHPDGICINGVLFYIARVFNTDVDEIICFDVWSEKFRHIITDKDVHFWNSVLVNYKGKLGALLSDDRCDRVTKRIRHFEIHVLEDVEKHEWSKHVYELPTALWKSLVPDAELYFIGVTSANEILLAPFYIFDPFYVVYYNIESKTIRRVQIQGMDAFKNRRVHTCMDHVENVKLIEIS